VTAVRRLLRATQRLLPARHTGLTVLAYHLVGAGTDLPVDLPAARFRAQMEELVRTARTVDLAAGLAELTTPAAGGAAATDPDSRPAVAVTFDDAYDNFRRHAWPVLAELAIPVTLFVPVGFVEGDGPAPIRSTEGLPALTWPALREMAETGLVTAGSHTWSHAALPALPAERVREELGKSRRVLEDRLGRPVPAFAYPRGLWSRRVEPLVGERYELAVTGGGRRVTAVALRPLRVPRTPIRRDGPESLRPLLTAPVWLEEWAADRFRRLRG
jgi:peptidoglycan/xylan/chitin deacetylase (PgdA/CDA1 family)